MDFKSTDKRTKSASPNWKCSFCDYKTTLKTDLYDHIRTHTKERPYKCPQQNCNSGFTKQSSLNAHQLIHKKEDESLYKFKCSKCPYKTMIKESLKRHLTTHSDVKQFLCDLCPFRSNHQENIKRHHNNVHLKLKPFKFPQPNCNYAFSRKSTLNEHQIVHQDANVNESLLKFQCPHCSFKASVKRNLTQHLRVHSDVKQFGCDLCPFRTKTKSHLNSHNKHVHSTLKPYKCVHPGCNFSCKKSSDLTHHMRVHVDEKPLSCNFPGCTFTTKWKRSLKDHEMVHRGEKPLKCFFCFLNFNQMSSLNCHVRGHTGETPFPCSNCPFRAKSSTNLKNHLKRCRLKTSGGVAVEKGSCLRPLITTFECKVTDCNVLTEQNLIMAIHYNNIHNLPRVDLTKTKI